MNGVSGRIYSARPAIGRIMTAEGEEAKTLPWLNMQTAIAAAVMISAFMRR
jgi:hypothetical protein